jgi:CHAT domain-containing protein/tetratricopeptide (TPR) repeat protein
MLPTSPVIEPRSSSSLEERRVEAERQLWFAPHLGLQSARAVYAAADDSPLSQAECALTLGIALNTTGRFAEAAIFLPDHDLLPQHLSVDRAIRYYSELTITYTWLGIFTAAREALQHACDRLAILDDPLAHAYCDRAEGLLQREQNHYAEAVALLQRAVDAFNRAGNEGEAVLTGYDLAFTLFLIEPYQARIQADQLRRVAVHGDPAIHLARCDYILAAIEDALNHSADSLLLYQHAKKIFAESELTFLAAQCDLNQGIAHYRLNHYEEAMRAYRRAREVFVALSLNGYVMLCDFNLAFVFFGLNRYTEALELYHRVATVALAEGRLMRAARCYGSMALCYDRLGQYDQALVLHERGRQAFFDMGNLLNTAHAEENLAGTYRRLGRHAEALQHYRQARETFAQQKTEVYVAHCDTHLADLYLALRQYENALACLTQARLVYEQQGMHVYAATCDREIARALLGVDRPGQSGEIFALLTQAQATFVSARLLIDAALCDLARGEAQLHAQQPEAARQSFAVALSILEPSFPDEAWRGHYGLGRCALMQQDRPAALEHWVIAVKRLQHVRAALPTELLSSGFFADHRPLHEAALRLALDIQAVEQALTIVEASKAQTVAGGQTTANWRDVAAQDDYARQLIDREVQLRHDIDALRHDLRVMHNVAAGPLLRGVDELTTDQPPVLARLTQLSHDYEQVVEQLRLVQPRTVDHAPHRLSIAALRALANDHWARPWACLAYYVYDAMIVTFYLDARQLRVYTHPLAALERLALRQCTSLAADYRELIYRHTLRGHRAPYAAGPAHLRQLYPILIPPEVADLPDDAMLIIAPHGPLHALPFQALLGPDGPLLKRAPLIYVPSLTTLQTLLEADQSGRSPGQRVLAIGLSDYGVQARSLPHADQEVAALRDSWGEKLDTLWGRAATRATILHLNKTAQLQNYAVLHFAAHAVLDPLAPSQSRILLADGSLTFVDILDLRLQARIVTLSACDGALGSPQPGDEMMALARAFFYAGVRAVVASLWPVEDEATGQLMQRFNQHLATGENAARSLRAAQLDLMAAGYAPYQWAAFVTIGLS